MSRCKGRCGGSCGTCQHATPTPAGMVDTRGRVLVEKAPPVTVNGTRGFDRNWDVQAFTGYPTSTVPAGQWNRGILYRQAQPVLLLRSPGPMYDPTDPATWRPGL